VKRRFCCILIALVASFIVGAGQAFAFQKDPDTTTGSATSVITGLLPPDATIGNLDTTVAGIGADVVGIDDSLTNPPPDPADSNPGTTYFVDNHTASDDNCPATPYTTIQAGIDASGPGDTVKVCPGTYLEQPLIMGHSHDGLKLESVTPLEAVVKWPAVDMSSTTYPLGSHHLVEINTANQVTLRGFTITGPFNSGGCNLDRHEGVLVSNAFDEHIHHNHVTVIQDTNPGLYGCQQGDAVAIGWRNFSTPGSAHVDHNQIDEYQKNGIQAVNQGTSLQADHNVVTGPNNTAVRAITAPNGFSIFNKAAATVDHNIVSNNQFAKFPLSTGIILDESPAGSSRVDHNRVFNNDYGVESDTQTNLEISHNDVFSNIADGITLCGDATSSCGPAQDNILRKNHITGNGGSGIFLFSGATPSGVSANLLKDNQIENNGGTSPAVLGETSTAGMHADPNSTNNTILNNHMQNNITFDCYDESFGTGTAGTSNTWQGDTGQTSSPPGICSPS
jgi:hypothetical protein